MRKINNNNNNNKKRIRRVNFTTVSKDHQGRMKIPQTTSSLEASQSEKDHVWAKRKAKGSEKKRKRTNVTKNQYSRVYDELRYKVVDGD